MICRWCEGEFDPPHPNIKYCGRTCRRASKAAMQLAYYHNGKRGVGEAMRRIERAREERIELVEEGFRRGMSPEGIASDIGILLLSLIRSMERLGRKDLARRLAGDERWRMAA